MRQRHRAERHADQVLRERRRQRRHNLHEAEHEAELRHTEPLTADVTGADEAGARSDGDHYLRQQQHFKAFGVGKDEDTERHQRDRNGKNLVGSEAVEQGAAEELADREGPGIERRDGANLRDSQAQVLLDAGIDDGVACLEAEQKDDERDSERPNPPSHRTAELSGRTGTGHVQTSPCLISDFKRHLSSLLYCT